MNSAAILEGRGRQKPVPVSPLSYFSIEDCGAAYDRHDRHAEFRPQNMPKCSANDLLGFDFCIAVQRGISRDSEKKTRHQFEGGVSLAWSGIGIEYSTWRRSYPIAVPRLE